MRLLFLLMLMSIGALAQRMPALKYQVYSDYLNATIAAADSTADTTYVQKSRSVLITPTDKWDIEQFKGGTEVIKEYMQQRVIATKTPVTTNAAAIAILDSWPRSYPQNRLKCTLDTNPDYVRLYFRLDSLMRRQNKLQPHFTLNYKVIIGAKTKALFKHGPTQGWQAFYRRYPNSFGLVSLSEVAFSEDMHHAALYVTQRQGGLAGSGDVVFLALTARGWKVDFYFNLWES